MSDSPSTSEAVPAPTDVVLRDDSVRSGSPFREGTAHASTSPLYRIQPTAFAVEQTTEGVYRETAASAFVAALMLLAFDVVAWVAFPLGGIAIAMLGVVMATIGLTSRYARFAGVALVLHGCVLLGCYLKLMA